MTTELKAKATVVLPPAVAKSLGLKKGDLFDVSVVDGTIVLVPIVIRPKKDYLAMEKELAELKLALGVDQPEAEPAE